MLTVDLNVLEVRLHWQLQVQSEQLMQEKQKLKRIRQV